MCSGTYGLLASRVVCHTLLLGYVHSSCTGIYASLHLFSSSSKQTNYNQMKTSLHSSLHLFTAKLQEKLYTFCYIHCLPFHRQLCLLHHAKGGERHSIRPPITSTPSNPRIIFTSYLTGHPRPLSTVSRSRLEILSVLSFPETILFQLFSYFSGNSSSIYFVYFSFSTQPIKCWNFLRLGSRTSIPLLVTLSPSNLIQWLSISFICSGLPYT